MNNKGSKSSFSSAGKQASSSRNGSSKNGSYSSTGSAAQKRSKTTFSTSCSQTEPAGPNSISRGVQTCDPKVWDVSLALRVMAKNSVITENLTKTVEAQTKTIKSLQNKLYEKNTN